MSTAHDAAGSAPPADEMVIAGRVEESSFADLLASLGRSRDTGLLVLVREGVRKTVYVQEGRVVFAASNDRDDRLGETLLREGTITVEQYEQSGRLIRPGKKQGTILVEQGYVTPAELVKGVKLQVETIALDLFRWRTGEYRVELREFDTRDIITLNISTENLVFQGVTQGAGWSQIVRGLGGTLDSVLERAQDAEARLDRIELTGDEARVAGLVDGRRSVAQICALSYAPNFATCLTLHGLACCGILVPVAVRDPESLFREQVAEHERAEIRADVEIFNRRLASVARLAAGLDPAFARVLDQALPRVLDAHWDALRGTSLESRALSADLVVENVDAVDSGRRRQIVADALAALAAEIVRRVEDELGSEAAAGARHALSGGTS